MTHLDKSESEQNRCPERKNIRRILLVLEDIVEYDRVKDLHNLVRYHGKLISYYGFDRGNGKWNTKIFPITQTDAQMEGINSDIQRYNNAVREYNDFAEYLVRKIFGRYQR